MWELDDWEHEDMEVQAGGAVNLQQNCRNDGYDGRMMGFSGSQHCKEVFLI